MQEAQMTGCAADSRRTAVESAIRDLNRLAVTVGMGQVARRNLGLLHDHSFIHKVVQKVELNTQEEKKVEEITEKVTEKEKEKDGNKEEQEIKEKEKDDLFKSIAQKHDTAEKRKAIIKNITNYFLSKRNKAVFVNHLSLKIY
jgi:glutamine synthetase adenylyltransferase